MNRTIPFMSSHIENTNVQGLGARRHLLSQLWNLNWSSGEAMVTAIRSRLLLILCVLSLVVNTLYLAATVTRGNYGELGVTAITVTLLLVVLVSAVCSGWRRWSAALYIFSAVLSLILYLVVNREVHASITIWVPFVPMLAMLLLDRRDGMWTTALSTIAIMVTALLVDHVAHGTNLLTSIYRSAATIFSIWLAAAATLAVMLVYVRLRDVVAEREKQEREARNTLLNILCHDISSHLTVIRFNTWEKSPPPECFKQIAHATESIVEMVSAVRAMRALEDGKLAIRVAPVDAAEAIRQAVEHAHPRYQHKGVTLKVDLPKTPCHVLAERVALSQTVLGNLLSNALKFTPPGNTVHIRCAERNGTAHISVQDDGVGIPRDLIPHLFDPGKQTSREGTHGETGTGFGLPLVEKMVDHFDGEIQVTSQTASPGSGSTFTVILPRVEVNQP